MSYARIGATRPGFDESGRATQTRSVRDHRKGAALTEYTINRGETSAEAVSRTIAEREAAAAARGEGPSTPAAGSGSFPTLYVVGGLGLLGAFLLLRRKKA